MFPGLSNNGKPKVYPTDPKFLSEILHANDSRDIPTARVDNLRFRQYRPSAFGSFRGTPLCIPIRQVVGISSAEEMSAIAARRAVARMADKGRSRVNTIMQEICYAVSSKHTNASQFESTVAMALCMATIRDPLPRPASIWAAGFINRVPKAPLVLIG